MNRMDREEFFGKLAGLDEERLKKALWNLCWRGNATLRERIEYVQALDQAVGMRDYERDQRTETWRSGTVCCLTGCPTTTPTTGLTR